MTMRSLILALALASTTAPAAMALEMQHRPGTSPATCATPQTPMQAQGAGAPVRPTAEVGSIPCPQFLSTTAIQMPRPQHRT
jgi:hypothetical protein